MAVADDLEGLHHWNTPPQHGRELPGKHCDVRRQNFPAGSKRGLGVLTRVAARLGAAGRLAAPLRSPQATCAYFIAALVLTFHKNWFLLACGCRYRHKSHPYVIC